MSATTSQFNTLLSQMGSDVTFHREEDGEPCPCRTAEGFRDPDWHATHPEEPDCNEQGFLNATVTEFSVKASIQPASRMTAGRGAQRANDLLGDVERDDMIGIFPVVWGGNTLNFLDWGTAGEDFILYDDRRFVAVDADKFPDVDGDPNHHWEVGLRLVKTGRAGAS